MGNNKQWRTKMNLIKSIDILYNECLRYRRSQVAKLDTKHVFADLAECEFMDMLQEDGKKLVHLAKSGELDFAVVLKGKHNHSKAIHTFLLNSGWSKEQIKQAFKELQRIITVITM
jgi:hypothetical protein